jgi:Zn-dependent protease with chaperone function
LWAAVLVPPLAWASDETISYALVKWACNHHTTTSIQLVTIVTVVVIAAAGLIGWRARGDRGGRTERERVEFMALFGAATALFFIVMTIAMAVPKWALHNVCV